VGVGLEREAYLAVAQPFLDHPGVFARRQKDGGVAVAQIVEPDAGKARPPENGLEGPADVPGVNRPPGSRGEYQTIISPVGTGLEPGFKLGKPVLFEDGGGQSRQGDFALSGCRFGLPI